MGDRIRRMIGNQAKAQDIPYKEAKRRTFTGGAALGTPVDPEDVAGMVAFLASEEGRHITAQDITIDAGSV